MHSIKIKLLLLFCVSVLGVYLLLVLTGIFFMQKEIEKETQQTLSMLINQEARELDAKFEGLERALAALEGYVRNNADTGVFVTDNNYGEYVRMPLTDLSAFEETDREHVAWYYEPMQSGKTIWLEPYVNKNINVYMTSFVAPIYLDGKFYGVVGLDLDMEVIQEIVKSIDYLNGSGYLLSKNGDVIYSKQYPEGLKAMELKGSLKEARNALIESWEHPDAKGYVEWKGRDHRIVTKNLRNGMVLGIEVPEKEIYRPVTDMIYRMLIILIFVVILLLIDMGVIQKTILQPIRKLKEASSRIAKGELGTQIDYYSQNELGELSESIGSIAKELREYFSYIHSQAYTDGMTGVGNKTSYLDMVKNLERKIETGMASFAVIVFDMNGLKQINDKQGHEAGDDYIADAADVLKNVVGAQHVYRIGGDEFMAVLENVSQSKLDAYLRDIQDAVDKKNAGGKYGEEPLALSKGGAIYDPEIDKAYKDVFKRADEAMYRDKAEYYRGKFDRRRR